jgi:hypothetical protein
VLPWAAAEKLADVEICVALVRSHSCTGSSVTSTVRSRSVADLPFPYRLQLQPSRLHFGYRLVTNVAMSCSREACLGSDLWCLSHTECRPAAQFLRQSQHHESRSATDLPRLHRLQTLLPSRLHSANRWWLMLLLKIAAFRYHHGAQQYFATVPLPIAAPSHSHVALTLSCFPPACGTKFHPNLHSTTGLALMFVVHISIVVHLHKIEW